jgi:hypothetical protein
MTVENEIVGRDGFDQASKTEPRRATPHGPSASPRSSTRAPAGRSRRSTSTASSSPGRRLLRQLRPRPSPRRRPSRSRAKRDLPDVPPRGDGSPPSRASSVGCWMPSGAAAVSGSSGARCRPRSPAVTAEAAPVPGG